MSEITRHMPAGDDDGLGPAQLAEHLRLLSKRTSAAARAYWLPLILFGALICASLPLYEQLKAPATARFFSNATVRTGLVKTEVAALGYYWQVALLVGVILTALWYQWHGRRTGLRTPARGFLITGLVISELVLLIPLLIGQSDSRSIGNLVHDTHQAGPLIIIAVLLWTLAWAEHSRALAIVTGCYLIVALVVCQFTNGGLAGGTTGAADLSLNGLRLIGAAPGVILLVAGVVAWLGTRRGGGDSITD
jgi:hypothetical protein